MTGAEMIATERRRQAEAEGWTPEHDAEHTDRQLAWSARCYLDHAIIPVRGPSVMWPWHEDSWKPSVDPVRDLVKAGALIAAEIDRLMA